MRWITADSALRSDRNWFAQRFADLFSKKYLSAPFQSVYPPILPPGHRKWVPRRAPRNMSKTLASHPTGNRKCLSHMPQGRWHILSVLHFILIQIPAYEMEGSLLLNSSGDKIAERFVYMWMCVCVRDFCFSQECLIGFVSVAGRDVFTHESVIWITAARRLWC